MHELHFQQRFEASPEKVFALLTDHTNMGKWLDGVTVTVEQPGEPAPNGLGAIRVVKANGLKIRERVVRWEAPAAMDYRVIGGAPLRDHLGEMRFSPDGSGTLLDYRIRFRVPWYFGGALLGSVVSGQLTGQIRTGLAKLAADLRT